MDIKSMIEGHREMIETMASSLKAEGFDKALLQRPIELHEQRAAGVKARIEALEAARRDYVAKADDDIKVLRSELSTIEATIKTERKNLASMTERTPAKSVADRKPATTSRPVSAARTSAKAAKRGTAKPSLRPKAARTAKRPGSKEGRK